MTYTTPRTQAETKKKKWAKKNLKKFFSDTDTATVAIPKIKNQKFFLFQTKKNKMPDVVIPLYFI
jgi:hypothetical protein